MRAAALLTSMNTGDCVALGQPTLSHPVDCGRYLLVADSFEDKAGPYTLTVSLAPSGAGCGAGPPTYNPSGAPGDPCGYPGDPGLPFCNMNLGGEICLYDATSSFCSVSCASGADCPMFPGGCCHDVTGKGELYCLPAGRCPLPPDAGAADAAPPDGLAPGADGAPDAAGPDAPGEPEDAGADRRVADAPAAPGEGGVDAASPPEPDGSGGCCQVGGGSPGASGAGVLLAALLLAALRRRGGRHRR